MFSYYIPPSPHYQVKVCRAYKDSRTGEELTDFPANVSDLERMQPVYVTMPGWTFDSASSGLSLTYADLPKAARDYVEFVEAHCEVPIRWIGIGASREAVVMHDRTPPPPNHVSTNHKLNNSSY